MTGALARTAPGAHNGEVRSPVPGVRGELLAAVGSYHELLGAARELGMSPAEVDAWIVGGVGERRDDERVNLAEPAERWGIARDVLEAIVVAQYRARAHEAAVALAVAASAPAAAAARAAPPSAPDDDDDGDNADDAPITPPPRALRGAALAEALASAPHAGG